MPVEPASDTRNDGATRDGGDAWLRAAFAPSEVDAIELPRTLTATSSDDEPILRMRSDGSVRWHGGLEALRQWQQAVDEACLDADPFRAWQLDDTVACLRGLVDCRERPARQSAALPNPARRAVRRAGRGDARRDVEAALAAGQLDSWLAAPVGRLQRVSRYLYELWLGRPDLHGLFPRVGDNDASTSAYLAWVRASGSRELAIPDLFMPSTGLVRARLASGLPTTRGVRVTGHVDETIGIGEAARRVEQALAREGIPHARLLDPASGEFDVDVLCINASEVGLFVSDVGAEHLARRYTIGVWFWESTSPPPNVDSALEVVDEVWVASDYVRQALAPYVGDTPIHVMPLAVREPAPVAHPRSHFALPEDAYLYGFMFDFNSTLERKNAIGLVEAYMRAYPEVRADTALVIKTIHAELNVADHERLLLATSDRDDIIVIDAHLSIEERDSMLGLLDCYVSLHRSEGFGLTIAEALLAGVPTIATGYSANVEFAPADV